MLISRPVRLRYRPMASYMIQVRHPQQQSGTHANNRQSKSRIWPYVQLPFYTHPLIRTSNCEDSTHML